MKHRVLIDTGPLVALLDRRDAHHAWAVAELAHMRTPLLTCAAVIAEAFHLLRRFPRGRTSIVEMIHKGVLAIPFRLSEEASRILALIHRYENVPMSLADACLVRMSELIRDSVVFTLDQDFRIYRRNKRRQVPVLMPG